RKRDKPDYFLKALQSALNIQQVFIPYIRERVDAISHDLVFITGVAAVYPFIRSHIILNNLQSITGERQTILFYPVELTCNSLRLFKFLKCDIYYRAYNLKGFKT